MAWNSLFLDKTTGKIDNINEENFQIELNRSGNNTQVKYIDNDANKYFLVIFIDTTHEYIVDKNGNITLKGNNSSILPTPVVLASIKSWPADSNTDFHKESIRNAITEIEFVDYIPNPINLNDSNCWDVSQEENQSIIAWLEGTKLYIGGKGGVKANEDSSCVFYNFSNLISINFNNNYNTSDVTNMNGMFSACYSLHELDISSFNTSKVTNMSYMFGPSYTFSTSDDSKKMNLTQIKGLNNFNTSNVTTMEGMFWNCGILTELDLSSFDTSKVTTMRYMFNMPNDESSKIKQITLGEKWNTALVTDMTYLFTQCVKLVTIYAYNDFSTDSLIKHDEMFSFCYSLRGGKGTKVSSTNITYAKIDKDGQTGYFTDVRTDIASNNRELEYIESTGTQYINTDVVPTPNTGFDIDLISYNAFSTNPGGTSVNGFGIIFGTRSSWYVNNSNQTVGTNIFQLATYTGSGGYPTGHFVIGQKSYEAYLIRDNRIQISFINGNYTIKMNGTLTTYYTDINRADVNPPQNLPLYLFTGNNASNQKSITRLYSFKLYEGDKLIREFIPVHNIVTNSAGLYDKVEGKFYPNNGTGEFVAGSEV